MYYKVRVQRQVGNKNLRNFKNPKIFRSLINLNNYLEKDPPSGTDPGGGVGSLDQISINHILGFKFPNLLSHHLSKLVNK